MEKYEVYGKRIEFILGLVLLIPPILGSIAFTISVFRGKFISMNGLGHNWTALMHSNDFGDKIIGLGTSAAPIYLGLMGIAGAYLIKDSAKSLFK